MTQKTLILVDGSSYLYRAFHALPSLTNPEGEPTGAIYGVINMLRKLLTEYQPEYIAVIFDAKGKTFRDEIFPAYKAHRPPMPEPLVSQIEPIHAIIKAMGLPLIMVEGVEADDVIGTLAKQAVIEGMHCLISTGDKDITQLVTKEITLINTMTDTLLDEQAVQAKFGIVPGQMIDYLTLIGDTVDNIPGVPNVGPKTAAKWLSQFGNLDELIKQADKITGKVGDNLRAAIPNLPLAKQLVTIKCDVLLPLTVNELQRQLPDQTALTDWYKRFAFKTWLTESLALLGTPHPEKKLEAQYETVTTTAAFEKWLQMLLTAECFAFDTETTSLNYMQAELVGIALATTSGQAAYIPLAHDYLGAPAQLERDWVLSKLKPVLTDPNKTIIGQNLKYDISILAKYGIIISAKCFDTMLESYVLNSASNRHDMNSLALSYLGKNTIKFEEVAGKGAKQLTFNQVSVEQASAYAAEDADITLQLHEALYPKLNATPALLNVFASIEMPLMPVLSQIERQGVLIDDNLLQKLSKKIASRLRELEEQAYHLAQMPFNLNSPKQLQEVLYQKLQIPIISKTPTGQPSTAENVLEELALTYPLPKLILEYRSLSKLKSTYTDKLPQQIDPSTRRVHTSYNQAVTSTGRLSSTDPNLQNIPIRTEEGRQIRQAFIAPKGYKIISADYSQIELRIMAHLSGDQGLLSAFAQDADIHRATAAEVFGVPLAEVTSEQRRSSKAINFGLIYGMSAFGLAQQLGVERGVAQEYMNVYFARYPGVKKYMEDTRVLAHEQGYVETLFGRRLYLTEINSSNMQRQKAAERAAINAPMQGTAADVIKLAMIKVNNWLKTSTLDVKMIMQVHDELVFEVAEKDVDDTIIHIRNNMMQAAELAVPLVVEVGVGDNWDEAH